MTEEDFIVTASDVKRAGFCITPGTRDFFKDRGWNFRDFIKNGILASKLEETGDARALLAVKRTRERRNG